MSGQKRSGWSYVFVGCGVLFLASVVAIGAIVFMTLRWTKNFESEMEDPQLRTAKAAEAMNMERLPEGYHVAMNINAPFGFGSLVMLTDGEPGKDAHDIDTGDHFFLYIEGPGWDNDWKEFVRGGDPPFNNLSELNIHIDEAQRVGYGELIVGSMEVFYSAALGNVSTEGFHRDEGVFSILLVRCPQGDKRSRVIVWSGPPPDEGSEDRIRGTTGDPARIAEMLGNFRLCD
jgi:hypothetical protein